MTKKLSWFIALTLGTASLIAQAAPTTTTPTGTATPITALAPVQKNQLSFETLAQPTGNFMLTGISPEGQVEFNVRSDKIVTQAMLNLEFTPSPSLIPLQSQLKIYLNTELVGIVPMSAEQLGKVNRVQIPIDNRYISDFNQLHFVFIGHYKNICEDPSNNTLWLDVSKFSSLDLTTQTLPLAADLSHFPEPFFDRRDNQPVVLPMVFAQQPDLAQQRAAAILASWFGSKAQWRGQSFPTLFNQLPGQNSIVFATNNQRPDFLKDHPTVNAPTVEMVHSPTDPYVNLLLVLGRDDQDLITAVKGIAQGNILFRGSKVTIDKVEQLAPRQPYDAPNWAVTRRPLTFAELQQYKEQLETVGVDPKPISLNFNLPPDLFLDRTKGIDIELKYRYTTPPTTGTSVLNIDLNNQFVRSYPLDNDDHDSKLLGLPSHELAATTNTVLTLPVLQLQPNNQLRFDFNYATPVTGANKEGFCEAHSTSANHVVIDSSSEIIFSNYHHFIPMPDLRVFINSGFPFSRLADLSQTWVVITPHPQTEEVSTLLNTLGNIGARTGYPALAMNLTDDWSQVKGKDADILIIGSIPTPLRDDKKINFLLDAAKTWIKTPFREVANITVEDPQDKETAVNSQTTVGSTESIAAILGIQSPYHAQRSIVALLANDMHGFELLNSALQDSKKFSEIAGSVSVIRETDVDSLRVGDVYYVGHLPWWTRIWYSLQTRPVLLGTAAVIGALLLALILRNMLNAVKRRRLRVDD